MLNDAAQVKKGSKYNMYACMYNITLRDTWYE